ncbi:MAG: hypothetical protein K2L66_05655, partial [Paramuribaculum sp.]|nr:hypothetical protein [Paramuribaculum sp.]
STSVCYVFENVNVIIPLTLQPRLWCHGAGVGGGYFCKYTKITVGVYVWLSFYALKKSIRENM